MRKRKASTTETPMALTLLMLWEEAAVRNMLRRRLQLRLPPGVPTDRLEVRATAIHPGCWRVAVGYVGDVGGQATYELTEADLYTFPTEADISLLSVRLMSRQAVPHKR